MSQMSDQRVVEVKDLTRFYDIMLGSFKPKLSLKALNGISFELDRGKTLAVVGESGCGKSTLARIITMIDHPTSGSLKISGEEIVGARPAILKKLRSHVQIVFQNPYGSLNPRQKIGSALKEPLEVNHRGSSDEREEHAREMMVKVGLRLEHFHRYPHMFSGGQRQRIAIARALMLEPETLVLDEPVSALDVSIQAQILNLLVDLQKRHNLAYLFISHDLSVVKHIADDVMVMYFGRAVEKARRDDLFGNPQHPYTQALLSATPVPDPKIRRPRIVLKGELPSPLSPPRGCSFHPRCPWAFSLCREQEPELLPSQGGLVACHAVHSPEKAP